MVVAPASEAVGAPVKNLDPRRARWMKFRMGVGVLCEVEGATISTRMLKRRVLPAGFIEPCIPILAHKPPAGPQWVAAKVTKLADILIERCQVSGADFLTLVGRPPP